MFLDVQLVKTPRRSLGKNSLACLVVCLVVGAPLASASSAEVQEAGQNEDKCQFNLFKPAPAELLREMSTDRPDKTESPYTVDAGHFQLEMDVFSHTHDDGTGVRTRNYAVGPVNLKAGLLNNVDFQLILEPFIHEHVEDRATGESSTQSGFGDLTTRLKINLWGNDSGRTAFALMPFVKFPTHQHDLGSDGVEGGLIVPLTVGLPAEWSMGVMTEFDFVRDSSGSGIHVEFINSLTFSHDICGSLAGYVEFFSLVSAEDDSDWIGTVDLGLTYAMTENVQLDAGVNLGVTDAADDANPFVGVSVRF